jgi:hypothetical protein
MAREKETTIKITDTVTGEIERVPEADAPDPVKITVNGKSYALDFAPASHEAFMALLNGEGAAKLWALAPAAKASKKGSGSKSGGKSAKSDAQIKADHDFENSVRKEVGLPEKTAFRRPLGWVTSRDRAAGKEALAKELAKQTAADAADAA